MALPAEVQLNFRVLREDWNEYQLADGTLMKVKHVLQKVFKRNPVTPEEKPHYAPSGQTISSAVVVPERLRGTPSTSVLPPEELNTATVEQDISFETIREEWNEYILDDGARLRLKVTLASVSRTSKFNAYGDPIYLVQNATIAGVKPPS